MFSVQACRMYLSATSRQSVKGVIAIIKPTQSNRLRTNNIRTFVTHSWSASMPIKTIDVPTMGDSITEGTIVDMPVAPGDYVQPDDVVVVLETDKVSVDVRAPEGGALIEVLGEIDDVVEVGSNLYRIDTDADAPESASDPMPEKEETLTPMTGTSQKNSLRSYTGFTDSSHPSGPFSS